VKYFWIAFVLTLAAVGPNIFPASQAGYSMLHVLAIRLLLPSILALALISAAIWRSQRAIARAVIWGAIAGALATIPLEIVRLVGFHFDYMPGNLPRLMGVLLLDRFAEGPSTASDIAGWTYHFWNGASFGIIYVVLFGTRRRWLAGLYGLLIGTGFMVSPVVKSLGVGHFGLQFSFGFPVTVILAHLAFGLALGFLARCFLSGQASTLSNTSAAPCPCCMGFDRPSVATRRL
jgi:hypothetical protein